MRYFTAILGSILIFTAVFVLAGLLLAWIVPGAGNVYLRVGLLRTSVIGLISFLLASLAARSSFKASLNIDKKRQKKKENGEYI